MSTFSIIAVALGLIGGISVLAIVAILLYQRRQRRRHPMPSSRPRGFSTSSLALKPNSHRYSGVSVDSYDDTKAPFRGSFHRNSLLSQGSPGSAGHAPLPLYDLPYDLPPPVSSSGHGQGSPSPVRVRPLSLNSMTYPMYPMPPSSDPFDPPSPTNQTEESLGPNDSVSQVHEYIPQPHKPIRSQSWQDEPSQGGHGIKHDPKKYEGILKLERLAPQPRRL